MRVTLLLLGAIARLPLRLRRRLLRLGWRLALPWRKEVGFSLEPFLEKHLRLGSKEARRLAIEHDFQDQLQIMEWLAGGIRSNAQAISDFSHVQVSDPALAERLAESGDSIILTPIHMGAFPFATTFVVWKYFAGRRILILRAREDDEDSNMAMDRLRAVAGELRILNTRNEADFMDAMRFARKGAVVISMIDLPESYGVPAETTLFNEPASIAFGLDAMARMLKAVVLPMTVRSDPSGDLVVFGQPFEVWQTGKEERLALARQVTAQIERFVRLAPEQWHMWTRIHEFFPRGRPLSHVQEATSRQERVATNDAA